MIPRGDSYSVSDVAYLLDLPGRTVIALCDAGVISTCRVVANGEKQQRKRRYVEHDEVIRFNATRGEGSRSDVVGRLKDPLAVQEKLDFGAEPEEQPVTASATDKAAFRVSTSKPVVIVQAEWLTVMSALKAISAKYPKVKAIEDKLKAVGVEPGVKGVRVLTEEEESQ